MKIRLELSTTERTVIVAALKAYGHAEGGVFDKLAQRIAFAPFYDPTADGPETYILSEDVR